MNHNSNEKKLLKSSKKVLKSDLDYEVKTKIVFALFELHFKKKKTFIGRLLKVLRDFISFY